MRIPPSAALACENEPIHYLGCIQPDGFLLSVDDDWIVARASRNIEGFLGLSVQEALGRPVRDLVDDDLLHDIRGCLQSAGDAGVVGRLFRRRLITDGPAFDIAAHRSGREFILEFETSVSGTDGSLSDLKAMISSVERQGTAQNLLVMAARHMRAFTGYDRVMVYRFGEDGSGEVVAESAQGDMAPYLGLRYPASDIPIQARALYERNFLRTITDVEAEPVVVEDNQATKRGPLDLSMSVLRSVSPVHREYLRNMGVGASMSVSILRGGRLWGLFACHHRVPRRIGYEMRSIVELFGQMFSYLLEAHEREDDAVFDAFVSEIRDRIVADVAGSRVLLDRLPTLLASIQDVIPCDGMALVAGGEASLAGRTPSCGGVLALLPALEETGRAVFATKAISEMLAPAGAYTNGSVGVLAMSMSGQPSSYVLLFRPEIVEKIVWAGEPAKSVTESADGLRLSPRMSFEAWRETVLGKSADWTRPELRAAAVLRTVLIELTLQEAERTHRERAGEGRRQEVVIAELNHRVRNILGLVHGLIARSAASAPDVRALVDSLDDRIRSLASAHDILTMAEWKPSSLHALLRAEISAYTQSERDLALDGPDIMLQPQAYTAMSMLIHELVTNARKHGALTSQTGRVTITTQVMETRHVAISWVESGGPPVRVPTRRGFGSTILEQAIPFECNGTSVPSYPSDGFRLDVTLPAGLAVRSQDTDLAISDVEPPAIDELKLGSILQRTLIVEDNLFIAFDAEDIMRTLGAGVIEVAKTVAEALYAIDARAFTFALLDVNLGAQTSLPVALALREAKVPFAFATGYRQALGMPASLADVTIVSKPYNRHAMAAALMHLVSDDPAAGAAVAQSFVHQGHGPAPTFHNVEASAQSRATPFQDAVRDRRPDVFSRRLGTLAVLSVDDIGALADVTGRAKAFERKKDIVAEGAYPQGLYVVVAGFACRFRLRADGTRQITSYLLPGDACDLSDVLGVMADSFGTLSDCRIATLSRAEVAVLKATYPQVAAALARASHIAQAVSREWLTNIGRRTSEERFAHLFCELLVRLQSVGLVHDNAYAMPLTQFDLGDTLGLSYVHVNRTLQALRRRELVSFKGRLLSILKLPELRKLAEFDPRYLQSDPACDERKYS